METAFAAAFGYTFGAAFGIVLGIGAALLVIIFIWNLLAGL